MVLKGLLTAQSTKSVGECRVVCRECRVRGNAGYPGMPGVLKLGQYPYQSVAHHQIGEVKHPEDFLNLDAGVVQERRTGSTNVRMGGGRR